MSTTKAYGKWGNLTPCHPLTSVKPRRERRFSRRIHRKTRLRTKMCLLGVAQPLHKILVPFISKTPILGLIIDLFSAENRVMINLSATNNH